MAQSRGAWKCACLDLEKEVTLAASRVLKPTATPACIIATGSRHRRQFPLRGHVDGD
jgi:hypothetical protein